MTDNCGDPLRIICVIDMSGLPAGSYLVVLCAEECVARRVGMW